MTKSYKQRPGVYVRPPPPKKKKKVLVVPCVSELAQPSELHTHERVMRREHMQLQLLSVLFSNTKECLEGEVPLLLLRLSE